MDNYILEAKIPLDGYSREFDGVTLNEETRFSVVSIAIPLGGGKDLSKAMVKTYEVEAPYVGSISVSPVDGSSFLGMAQDQILVLNAEANSRPVEESKNKLGDFAYYTDQSDSYVLLKVYGLNSRKLLERICPLDLDPSVFTEGSVARTVMEHMGVTIVHQEKDSFLLMSARSSSKSFLEAVETSAEYIND